jgi:hypothetical protein
MVHYCGATDEWNQMALETRIIVSSCNSLVTHRENYKVMARNTRYST